MKLILTFLFILFSSICYSQSETYPCKFQIVDSRTKAPIIHALVTVDQDGLRTMASDDDGFCDFKTVPVGRIDVTISHENYRSQRIQRTVSSEIKNNTFIIELVPFSENSLLVMGKVSNRYNQNFDGVKVEIKVDGKPYTTTSDPSGNYRFDITSAYIRSEKIQIEFSKRNCRYNEEILVPERRIVIKNISLTCPDNSNEEYNDSVVAKKECEKNNTGDYCFLNNSNKDIVVAICDLSVKKCGGGYLEATLLILKPGETKCLYDYSTLVKYEFHILTKAPDISSQYLRMLLSEQVLLDQGYFKIERCKSKTYSYK